MTAPPPVLLRASWVAPICAPIIIEGAVAFAEGKILAVGPWTDLRQRFPHAVVRHAEGSLLLPGLVNAHAHLELSSAVRGEAPAGFVPWLMDVMSRAAPAGSVDRVERAVETGVAQCLKFGVTTVGDITRQCRLARAVLGRSPLRVVSYGEVAAMAGRRGLLEQRLATAADVSTASDRVSVGISPHAPYSIEPAGYARCLEVARRGGFPMATHLAESPGEAEFLADHRGNFRELWERLGAWDDAVPRFAGGPIRLAKSLGLLDEPTLLAHVNYCDDDEMALLAAGKASVCYCPRTHAFFGHPPHRWREMLAAGINVTLGTDSCASSPDLNLVDDLRLLHRTAPDVPPALLWEMATRRAAEAIGLDAAIGTLEPGMAADFVIFPASGNDPLRAILETDVLPAEVWIEGTLCH